MNGRVPPSLTLSHTAGAFVVVALATYVSVTMGATGDCTAIEEESARLTCYDRLHGRKMTTSETTLQSSHSSIAGVRPESPAARLPDTNPPADSELGAELPPSDKPGEQLQESEVLTRVAGSGKGITGRLWFRLEDGQLWEQVTPRRSDIVTGDIVRITKGALGAYHLRRANGSSRSTQVRRLE